MTIYCDMDGVVASWEKARDNLVGPGASKSQTWKAISKAGHSFWASIPEFKWSRKFYDDLKRTDDTCFLTSPSLDPSSCSGKLEWLQRFTEDRNFRNYIITNQKYRLAYGPGAILIDDKEKHVDAFNKKGGIGILFPRPYNRARDRADDPVSAVMETLSLIYPGRIQV